MSKAEEKAREYVSQKLKENGYLNFNGTECVECAYISGYTQSVTDLSTENAQLREALREAVANYMQSEGCSCCRDTEAHEEHTKVLAELLDVEMYEDNSGYNFHKYRTKAKRLITYKEDK